MYKEIKYTAEGYLDTDALFATPYNCIIINGGRGTGKTYGSLQYMIDNKKFFMLMRRTQTQCNILRRDIFNPFKAINRIRGIDIGTSPEGEGVYGYYHQQYDADKGKKVSVGDRLGLLVPLSTFSNLRGFDIYEAEYLIFDEFNPEKGEKKIPDEALKFFNAYESINRNREIDGLPPLRLILMSNSNTLNNDIMLELGLVLTVEKMKKKGQTIYRDDKRSLLFIMMDNSPMSNKKEDTFIYNLAGDSQFKKMAIDNDYAQEDMSYVRSCNLKEYRPISAIGEITIYERKSRRRGEGCYYVSGHLSGTPRVYSLADIDKKRFMLDNRTVWREYLMGHVYFESYYCELIFQKFFN